MTNRLTVFARRLSEVPSDHLLRVALVVVVLLAPLSGCVGLLDDTGGDSPLPDSETAAEKRDSLETFSATVTTVRRVDGETHTAVRSVAHRFDPLGYRAEVVSVETSGPDAPTYTTEGRTVVANESVLARYDPDDGTVSYRGSPVRIPRESYRDVLEAARGSESLNRSAVTVPALPRVPADSAEANASTASYYDYEVTAAYNGTATVDGREAYRLDVTPTVENATLDDLTVWLDTETLFPLRQHVVFTAEGEQYTFEQTYENVTVNPTLDPATFRLTPSTLPPDTEFGRLDYYEDPEALAANSSVPLPGASLPDGYEFDRAFYVVQPPELAIVQYTGPDGRTLRVTALDAGTTPAPGESVRVGEGTGQLRRHGDVRVVEWRTDRGTYSVSGPVDRTTLLRVARTVDERVTR
jgi:outer membrane lipoprotein-sorting protein